MRTSSLLPVVLARAGPPSALARSAPYDGHWTVTLACPPQAGEDDAKGYVRRFPADVVNGQLRAEYGTRGEPGWHVLTGPIAANGNATLHLEGVVSEPRQAARYATRGRVYKYRVRAHFEPAAGSGKRLGGRACEFSFAR